MITMLNTEEGAGQGTGFKITHFLQAQYISEACLVNSQTVRKRDSYSPQL